MTETVRTIPVATEEELAQAGQVVTLPDTLPPQAEEVSVFEPTPAVPRPEEVSVFQPAPQTRRERLATQLGLQDDPAYENHGLDILGGRGEEAVEPQPEAVDEPVLSSEAEAPAAEPQAQPQSRSPLDPGWIPDLPQPPAVASAPRAPRAPARAPAAPQPEAAPVFEPAPAPTLAEAPTPAPAPELSPAPVLTPEPEAELVTTVPIEPAPAPTFEPSPEPTPEPVATTSSPEEPPIDDDISDEELAQAFRVRADDASQAVVDAAIDRADIKVGEKSSGKGFRGAIKRIWESSIARDFTRQKEQGRQRTEMVANQRLTGYSEQEQKDEFASVVDRRVQGIIREGETDVELSSLPNGQELEQNLRELVKSFASDPTMSDDALQAEKIRLLKEYGKTLTREDRNKGLLFADNVMEVAQHVRAAVNNGIGLDRIDRLLNFRTGDTRTGADTRPQFTAADRIIDRAYKTKLGSLVNETTLMTAVGIGMSAAKFTSRKAASAAGLGLIPGATGAVGAALRRHFHLGQERSQHIRERAVGDPLAANASKQRERMESTRYETVGATETAQNLADARAAVEAANPASINEMVDQVAELRARLGLGSERSIDLIDFSGKTVVEQERWKMLLELSKSEVEARHALGSANQADLEAAGIFSQDLDDILAERSDVYRDMLMEDITSKDQTFQKMRRSETAKAAAIGFATGEVVGLGLQEVRGLLEGSMQSVFEHAGDDQHRRTLLAAMFRHGATHSTGGHETVANGLHDVKLGDHASLKLPQGYHLEHGTDGHWNLLGTDGKPVAEGLAVNDHGHLTEASQHLLHEHGFNLAEHTDHDVTHHITHEDVRRTPHEFLDHHPGEFTKVHRQLWYDNDTPNVFDHNELRMDWGGQGGSGIDEHGNYVFNLQHMTADGSWHDGASADAPHLIQGHDMKVALSMTKGTQEHVIMVNVNEHGQAIIHADSVAGRSMFESHDGHATFTGAYAEAAQIMNQHGNEATTRMLATVVGENHVNHVVDHVSHLVSTPHEHTVTTLTAPGEAVSSAGLPVEIPAAIPITAFRGLEQAPRPSPEESDPNEEPVPYGYYGYDQLPERFRHEYDRDRSPRLQENPEAVLNPAEELAWHRQQLAEHNPEYLHSIDEAIESSPELRDLPAQTRAIITIPVGATAEADNIFNTLSLYDQQEAATDGESTILLHVNWFADAVDDPVKAAAIEKTIQEIDRAREAFPNLRIATVTSVWNPEERQRRDGGVIGLVAQKMFDTALLSAERAKREGGHDPDQDIAIIRNDADAQHMGRNYVRHMIDGFAGDPGADALVGNIRWEVDDAEDMPGLALLTLFRETMHVLANRGDQETKTFGINTSIRASTLAAVGGLGRMDPEQGTWAGAGSDDLQIGYRIHAARRRTSSAESARGSYGTTIQSTGGRQRTSALAQRLAALAGRKYGGYSDELGSQSSRETVKYLPGAYIDSAVARVRGVYQEGRPITQAWNDFGSRNRDDAREVAFTDEDPVRDRDAIISRLESNVTAMGNDWYRSPSYMELGLRLTTGGGKAPNGQPLYDLVWKNGRCTFRFTDAGKEWVAERLVNVGARLQRGLLNVRQPGDTAPLLNQQPYLLSPAA